MRHLENGTQGIQTHPKNGIEGKKKACEEPIGQKFGGSRKENVLGLNES
jgi:hypothetical protein